MSRGRKKSKLESAEPDIPFLAPRNDSFQVLIKDVLTKAILKSNIATKLGVLFSPKAWDILETAFTGVFINPEKNYEYYEQLGDVIIGQFLVWYSYRRYPRLCCAEGVKVVARIRINYGSRESLSRIADSLGFWPYISAMSSQRDNSKKDLLEDVFEAFIGAVALIIDDAIEPGEGYKFAYILLTTIFDKIHISLRYTDLFDAKTRLKELFECYKGVLGLKPIYTNTRIDSERMAESIVSRIDRGNMVELGRGRAPRQAEAEQYASDMALTFLNKLGYKKPVLPIYD